MPKKAHTEEQLVAVLWQAEAEARVDNVCHKVGISQAISGPILSRSHRPTVALSAKLLPQLINSAEIVILYIAAGLAQLQRNLM